MIRNFSANVSFLDTQELSKINSLEEAPSAHLGTKSRTKKRFVGFHLTETALIFTQSGCYYWFFSAVPQKQGDLIYTDELCPLYLFNPSNASL
jgi:hypothetical protein